MNQLKKDIKLRFHQRLEALNYSKLPEELYAEIKKRVYDLDYSDPYADYEDVAELLHSAEIFVGIARGNYTGL